MRVQQMPGHLIRRLHQVSTQIFASKVKEAGFDMTSVQFAALDAINANPGVDQAKIAALIAYDKATIGGVIDRLEKKGLVVRTVSARDRRAREVSLSDEGKALLENLEPVVTELQGRILTGLSDEERDTFLRLARKALRLNDGVI